jgi:ATP-binding cassette subfamily F protein 3
VLAKTGELVIQRGDRVAIIGPNGAGKTTALRTIIGEIPALKGGIEFGTNVKVAYYAQGHEGLDPRKTAMDTILADQPMGEEAARSLLGRFLFTGDDAFKRVGELSGGERSRLALARLSLERANFMILDEPTNHLDIPARESLEEVLLSYDGTLLFVSHDRYFIDRIASRVWAIEGDVLETYLGNYTDMMHHRALTQSPAQETAKSAPEPKRTEEPAQPTTNRSSQRSLEKKLRESQKRLSAAERSVSRLEDRLNKLSDDIAAATAAQDVDRLAKLGTEYEALQGELETAYAEWSAAGADHDELEIEVSAMTGNGS